MQLASKFVAVGLEYFTASDERKQELLAEADAHYQEARSLLAGIDGDVAKNNADIDAAAQEKFEEAPTVEVPVAADSTVEETKP